MLLEYLQGCSEFFGEDSWCRALADVVRVAKEGTLSCFHMLPQAASVELTHLWPGRSCICIVVV